MGCGSFQQLPVATGKAAFRHMASGGDGVQQWQAGRLLPTPLALPKLRFPFTACTDWGWVGVGGYRCTWLVHLEAERGWLQLQACRRHSRLPLPLPRLRLPLPTPLTRPMFPLLHTWASGDHSLGGAAQHWLAVRMDTIDGWHNKQYNPPTSNAIGVGWDLQQLAADIFSGGGRAAGGQHQGGQAQRSDLHHGVQQRSLRKNDTTLDRCVDVSFDVHPYVIYRLATIRP